MVRLAITLVFLGGTLGACGGGDALENDEHIAGWANSASALGAYTHGYEPLAAANADLTFADPSCPGVDDDGTTMTITGDGCANSDGDEFFGSAVIVRSTAAWTLTLTEYGHARDGGAVARVSGTVIVTETATDSYTFDVDVTSRGGLDMDVQYSGSVDGTHDGPTLWNGAGTIVRDGPTINPGTITATTVDQLRDNDICSGEGISGTTTMESEEHVVVVTYDGATDCDDDNSARFSRDGVDGGTVKGVTCSSGGGAPTGLGVLLLVSLALQLRRRAARRPAVGTRET